MKKFTLKERIKYKIENKLSNNPLEFIKIIAILTVFLALIIAGIIESLNISDENFLTTFWDTLASSINAWMPYSEDANNNVIRIILTSIAAIFGLFVTSLLISLISNAIEEKIEDIKKGNTIVVENDHIVILGFIEGEYTLIKELIKGSNGKKLCLVIGCSQDKEDVERLIYDNVKCPNNCKIICRTINSITISSLECLSIDTCKSVIINPMDDEDVIKYIFVLNHILLNSNRNDVVIVATIRDKQFVLPKEFSKGKNIFFLVLSDFVSRIISKTSTQPGLSLVYLELFNNKGSELYTKHIPELVGKNFEYAINHIDNGVPIGVINSSNSLINPNNEYIFSQDDDLIVFSEDKDSAIICNEYNNEYLDIDYSLNANKKLNILILGYNDSFDNIINDVDLNNVSITLVGLDEDKFIYTMNKYSKYKINILSPDYSIDDYATLEKLTQNIDRIILLNNYSKNGDSADVKIMLRLIKIREIRNKYKRDFTICVELRRASNRTLIHKDDYTDYVVRTNMLSMFLSQLVMNPELKYIYDELLSKEGYEIKLLNGTNSIFNNHTTYQIRRFLYKQNMIYLGLLAYRNGKYECYFNPRLDDKIEINEDDSLIVIHKN